MCKVGVRCAADTREACRVSAERYAAKHGNDAPRLDPVRRTEVKYAKAAVRDAGIDNKLAARDTVASTTRTPAPTPAARPNYATARSARLANPEVARRAAVTLGASGRLAGQGAIGAMAYLASQRSGNPSRGLSDPARSHAALRASTAGTRTAASAALTGVRAHQAALAASGGGRNLRAQTGQRAALGTLTAGTRTSASSTLSAQRYLASVGKAPERSPVPIA